MDPNETLRMIREALAKYNATQDADEAAWSANDLATHIEALDEWLTKGGLLPKPWDYRPNFLTADEISDLKDEYYHKGKEDGGQEGFANGYNLAQEHMHTHLLDYGFTGDH